MVYMVRRKKQISGKDPYVIFEDAEDQIRSDANSYRKNNEM